LRKSTESLGISPKGGRTIELTGPAAMRLCGNDDR
jgi:hypothetical protein